MPSKLVAGYTQVPVVAADILRVTHDRLNDAGTVTQVTVDYQVRDDASVVRDVNSVSFQAGSYPTSGASIIAACNSAEGT
jgi:hypothetical protein